MNYLCRSHVYSPRLMRAMERRIGERARLVHKLEVSKVFRLVIHPTLQLLPRVGNSSIVLYSLNLAYRVA